MRILVVDDDEDIALMLVRILTRLGHQAECCSEPATAIQQSLFESYDIVMADYVMGPYTGLDVLRAYNLSFRVLLTASYNTTKISDALRDGVVHMVLTKPATLADLSRVLYAAARAR